LLPYLVSPYTQDLSRPDGGREEQGELYFLLWKKKKKKEPEGLKRHFPHIDSVPCVLPLLPGYASHLTFFRPLPEGLQPDEQSLK
jgi:hypothetical protein